MKSFALLSLAAAVAAVPAPDHVVTALVTCKDNGYAAKETVTVTAPCSGNGGNGGYSQGNSPGNGNGNGGYNGNGNGNPQAPVTVTVTATQTKTETVTQGGSSGGDSTPPAGGQNTYTNGGAPGGTTTATDVNTATATATNTNTDTAAPGTPATHTIAVGAFPRGTGLPPAFEFRPNNVTAKRGDVVRFQMLSKAHSVTQSKFDKPCVKTGPFDTELVPNMPNATDIFRDFTVDDASKPVWMYCKQKAMNHCGTGMVFGINPKSDAQMQQFIDMARQQNGTVPAQPTLSSVAVSAAIEATAVPTTVGGAVNRFF